MSNKLMEAGFGQILAYLSGHTNILPAINNINNVNGVNDTFKAGVSSAQTVASVWEMIGKDLPIIKIGGKSFPVTAVILSTAGLAFDISSMSDRYQDSGKIEIKDLYSALGNISSAASAIALAGVLTAGAAAAPVLLATATALTVAGAVLSIASVAAEDTIDVDSYLNSIRESLQPLSEALGDAYQDATQDLIELMDSASDGIEALLSALDDLASDIAEGSVDLGSALAISVMSPYVIPAAILSSLLEQAASMTSPLIVDLDGDGVETADRPVHFDHDGNGYAQLSGWVGKDDGLLVLDRNGNHKIDDGSELFGNHTVTASGELAANGFLALADYDSNGDGIINAQDDIFSSLQIWQDRNGDGITDEGELIGLEQAGIDAIHLNWSESNKTDQYGNQYRQQGSYIKSDGTMAEIVDVWFKQDSSDRQDKNRVEVSDDIARLPDIIASGNVSDLQQSIAQSGDNTIRSLVEQFIQQQDKQQRYDLVDILLRQWSGAAQYSSDSRGGNLDAQKLYTLEAFLGRDFNQHGAANPLPEAARKIESAYNYLLENVYAQLMLQTHLADLIQQVSWQVENQHITWDACELLSTLRVTFEQDHQLGLERLIDLRQALIYVDSDFTQQLLGSLTAQSNTSGGNFERALTLFLFDTKEGGVFGSSDHDTLSAARYTASVLFGFEGNDKLYGSVLDDILYGCEGDDYLNGSAGNDIYRYAQGDGHDTIEETYGNGYGDRLELENIDAAQVTITRDGRDMLVMIAESAPGAGDGGSVRLLGQAAAGNDGIGVEWLAFADGTVWDRQMMRDRMFASAMTSGDDRILGSNADDVLRGGRGDDYLNGSAGNDIYRYAQGDGHDTIEETYGNGYGDRLELENIDAAQVTITRDGRDMLVMIAESAPGAGDGGSVRLLGQAAAGNDGIGVEWLAFADGTVWDRQMMRDRMFASAMTSGDDRILGSNADDVLRGGRGDDYLNGSAGNDTYVYAQGDGHDTIEETYGNGYGDRLKLENIDAAQVSIIRDGRDMLVMIAESAPGAGDGGSVRLLGQAAAGNDGIGVEWLAFADGSVWDRQTMRDRMFASAMTSGDDRILGSNADDVLRGGRGDDYLNGSAGNDTYVYAQGDGHDTIEETYGNGYGDRLKLENIDAAQVSIIRDGRDMLVMIAESAPGAGDGGSVRLLGQANAGNNSTGVEWIEFADGNSWNKAFISEQSTNLMQSFAVINDFSLPDGNAEPDIALLGTAPPTAQELLWI